MLVKVTSAEESVYLLLSCEPRDLQQRVSQSLATLSCGSLASPSESSVKMQVRKKKQSQD